MIRLALLIAAPLLLLAGCQTFGITCQPGTTQCGQGCADLRFDNRNCGACGNGCAANQACIAGLCQCSTGTTQCGALCAEFNTDPQNCGGCANDGGVVCASNQVCEKGQCKDSCQLGVDQPCDGGCFDFNTDPTHCGTGCDNYVPCLQGQACHSGLCAYEVVAACFTSGQVVGMSSDGIRASSATSLGTAPASLASFGTRLLSADGDDHLLHQADLHSLAAGNVTTLIGGASNQVVADSPFAYVINAGDDTLQILIADGGADDGGQPFTTIGELNFGMNTFPEAVAKSGDGALWVPLYGGVGSTNADAGQRIVRVDISNPATPTISGQVDLHGIDLHAFDGGHPVARPFAIVSHRGSLYAPLNNLDPGSYAPAGPGMIAKIDPSDAGLTTLTLDANACLDPAWLTSDGTHLFVSCIGAALYDADAGYKLIRSDGAGVVMLDENDAVVSTWAAQCPADAGCAPILPSRMAVKQGRLFVGDSNGGRVFGFDITDAGLVERFGYANGNSPIEACPLDSQTGIANVSDVLAVP